ncbi:hypothetical protein SO802_003842 [Lithocarpus litseifolius]|uniref:RNase H type-1 domain-containing protein n=1 Tax=Lithocarpus litseifolius TaxID=425828 RepID=A0AAW2E1C7_9ROSI
MKDRKSETKRDNHTFTRAKMHVIRRVRWEKPDTCWVKLNYDGSSRKNPGVADSGGLIRNEKGEWICGFAKKIGITTRFTAELWGLRDGLLQCLNLNLSSVLIELDAKAIVDLLANPDYSNNVISPLVDDCRFLMAQLLRVQVRHYFQKANRCANALARLRSEQSSDFLLFNCPPVDIVDFFNFDANGLYLSRLCPEPVFSL